MTPTQTPQRNTPPAGTTSYRSNSVPDSVASSNDTEIKRTRQSYSLLIFFLFVAVVAALGAAWYEHSANVAARQSTDSTSSDTTNGQNPANTYNGNTNGATPSTQQGTNPNGMTGSGNESQAPSTTGGQTSTGAAPTGTSAQPTNGTMSNSQSPSPAGTDGSAAPAGTAAQPTVNAPGNSSAAPGSEMSTGVPTNGASQSTPPEQMAPAQSTPNNGTTDTSQPGSTTGNAPVNGNR